MRIAKLRSYWTLVGGILVILIGIAHSSFTPMLYRKMAEDFPAKALGMAYVFAVMGVYVVLSGWLLVYASRGLLRQEAWARTVVATTGGVNALAFIGALLVGMNNALILVWGVASISTCLLALASPRPPSPARAG